MMAGFVGVVGHRYVAAREKKKRQMTVADSPLAATSMLETEKQQGVSLGTSVAHEFSKLHPSMVMILS